LIRKWPLGHERRPVAQALFSANPKLGCYDRASSAWKDAGKPPVPGMLLGADNDELVFSQNQGLIKLVWAKLQ
jgi:hypothetical protein